MKYGYARVSTKDQILDMQIDALKKQFYEAKYKTKVSEPLKESDDKENFHITSAMGRFNGPTKEHEKLLDKVFSQPSHKHYVFVLGPKSKEELPSTWEGFPVIDADQHDYRFLDKPGAVSGLRAKGEAKHQSTDFGFVIQPDDPGLDPSDPAVIKARKDAVDYEKRVKAGKLTAPGYRRDVMRQAAEKLNLPSHY